MESLENKLDVQFRKGTLEMSILALLNREPMFGLQLLKKLHEFETLKITEGTLYPLLDRLKREKVVESFWVQEGDARPRKYYQLSEVGKHKLNSLKARWRKSIEDIQVILEQ